MIPHNTNTTATAPLLSCAALIAGTLLSGLPAPAIAGADDDLLSVAVTYDDLDPATRHGAQELYSRITNAALKVCWPLDHGGIRGIDRLNACLSHAVSDAVAKLDIPAVTALHGRHHNRSALAAGPAHR